MEIHQHQNHTENISSLPPTNPASPSSSPSHEFSFTISLHPSIPENSSKAPHNSLAVDLSPADDIFFHGHLLPLHLLSQFPSSPRFSTNSLDSFTLPIREDKKLRKDSSSCNTSNREEQSIIGITKEENRAKNSFSLFGLTKGRKGCQIKDKEDKENHKRKLGNEVMHAVKRYLRMVLFRGRREKIPFHGQAYSHSGNLMRRSKPEVRGRRGECSAPASMRASPTNSGLLLATTTLPPASDSTMEELQAAIQAAIAHCKNSSAKEEKLSC
ncbi:BRI1 kinase inhibitor 1 [Lotus japonicus]|uniref:BRI1 kinase inhibitor 1 n=1 Tax=Lotus japonicus TaxID=34305 RepID=I3T1R5_LOTJA|nr:BRI1 kinase inhibitor 1 [Lotus japonicus]AFK46457.1 unknown [Lotus japonicus]